MKIGLFDKFASSKDVRLTPKGAFALATMTMIGIDGSIEDEELATLQRIIRGDKNAFDEAFKIYKDLSVDDCIQTVASALDQKQKVAVLTNLIDVAMADGILAGSEKTLLTSYINSFQVQNDVIETIVDVIAMKNNLSIFD